MVRLVDDLLEISRITRGKIDLRRETVELSTVVQSAVETSLPLIESAHHQLTVTLPDEPILLDGDPVRLTQVVANLLNNAAKYTNEGGQIWLTATRDGKFGVLSVKDNGAGIPADVLPTIFDLFTQANRTYERAPGRPRHRADARPQPGRLARRQRRNARAPGQEKEANSS